MASITKNEVLLPCLHKVQRPPDARRRSARVIVLLISLSLHIHAQLLAAKRKPVHLASLRDTHKHDFKNPITYHVALVTAQLPHLFSGPLLVTTGFPSGFAKQLLGLLTGFGAPVYNISGSSNGLSPQSKAKVAPSLSLPPPKKNEHQYSSVSQTCRQP